MLTEEKCKFRKALEGKLEILSFHLRSPVGKGKMTIPQVQGGPAMELVELIKRRSVSGLNVVGGETSITFSSCLTFAAMFQDKIHVFVARSSIAFAIVHQLMIRFVFIILLSFTNNHPRELLCPNSNSGAVWV